MITRESEIEYDRWRLVVDHARDAGVDPDHKKFDLMFKAIGLWGEALAALRATQTDEVKINATSNALVRYQEARKRQEVGRGAVKIERLGHREMSRIEPNLPHCPNCGAPAEIKTASWTWVDYVICSARCGVSTYPPKGGEYDGLGDEAIWNLNIKKWMAMANREAKSK